MTEQQRQSLFKASSVLVAIRDRIHEGLTRQLSHEELLRMWQMVDAIHNIPSDVARGYEH